MKNRKKKHDRKYLMWRNMMNGNHYLKGEFDSYTNRKVLAIKDGGNVFGPETCYFDYVSNLPAGTYYVTDELEYY